ncbi:MAG: M23 family metallopeptidase [Deltaproteobacteria bacterium]|nr:M23 family metallopeptidase [Deltaproteobacteria bacterium]
MRRRHLRFITAWSLLAASSLTACGDETESPPAQSASEAAGETATVESEQPAEEEAPPPTAEEVAEGVEAFEGNFYVLRPGETEHDLAVRYGVEDTAVHRQHQLGNDWYDAMNERLRHFVPDIDVSGGPDFRLDTVGFSHIIAEAEDIHTISEHYKTSIMEILVVNAITPEEALTLEVGRRIFIPGVVTNTEGHVSHLPHPREEELHDRAHGLHLGTRAAASKLLRGEMEDEWLAAAEGERGGEWDGTFGWPVAGGWFVRGFGSGEQGYHKAVDVGGNLGWPVRAIERGIVAYADDTIRGYGNLVMVIHPQGFVSFYAHNSSFFVQAGQMVNRGQIISETGSTGISRGPHVHFELIHEHNNCDPAPLFRPGVRRHNGEMMDIPQLTWSGDGPPRGLRCEQRPSHHPNSQWVVHEHPVEDASPRSGVPGAGGIDPAPGR